VEDKPAADNPADASYNGFEQQFGRSPERFLIRHLFTVLGLLLFIPSQVFWLRQLGVIGRKLIRSQSAQRWAGWIGAGLYAFLLIYNIAITRIIPDSAHLTVRAVLLQAPFGWWMLSSIIGFVAIALFYAGGVLVRGLYWSYRKLLPAGQSQALLSPERRHFLYRTAVLVSASPFAACAYGMLYERRDIETTRQRIKLPRLPKAFDGFRIAQISDIHIGPFMPAEDVRRCVAMVNQLKPDLVALTGDFVTWKASPEVAVVEALSGIHAPFGIFGCLGNHEIWAGVQDSITRLFAAQGTRILRLQNVGVDTSGERLNLIGVDYQMGPVAEPSRPGIVTEYLEGVGSLIVPDTVNILLSHNPNTFDRAAELGIDLSLAGHTHGGQIALEYISPDISPARLITPYVRGWFQKGNSQLYVNRGIGTIFSPVRIGSPPEITLYELQRG
jgi:predicted MPP superfamily phosphohydrolase